MESIVECVILLAVAGILSWILATPEEEKGKKDE